jgi:hypothetical protein
VANRLFCSFCGADIDGDHSFFCLQKDVTIRQVYNSPVGGGGLGGFIAKEERIVDPKTGAEKGMKLARFSLIPPGFVWALAEHYGKGAKKYTRYGECSCVKIAEDLERLIQDNVAGPVTKSGFVKTILNLPSANYRTAGVGVSEIQTRLKSWSDVMEVAQLPNESGWPLLTNLAWKNTIVSYPNLAAFAENQTSLDTLTTIILQVGLGALSVIDATLQLDSLKRLQPNGLTKHWSGCKAHLIEKSGDRNWEQGYKWSLSVDASQRHLHQWLQGEDNDEETGSSHLIAAAWHLCALWFFHKFGKGTNDVRQQS